MLVSLQNLLKIGQLKEHATDIEEVRRLLAAAERGLTDAGVTSITPETRFDAAYRAVTQIGLVMLLVHGFRPDTNRPGHHVTIIQTLPSTLGITNERMVVLDTLRRKRNLVDYTGEDIDDASVAVCLKEGQSLLDEARSWIKQHRPELAQALRS
jgi:hypothetical protein